MDGRPVGTATRSECHGNPALLHQVVHVMVRNAAGDLLLQLRSPDKDIQPGKWDTSVGGHLAHGESITSALVREIAEEIGVEITPESCEFCYSYTMRNEVESELVQTYSLCHDGLFTPQPEEVAELRFWSLQEIDAALGTGVFTPNFEEEYDRYCKWSALCENKRLEED
ncbi:MAG: NUDIX domain-containing protein [Planctomycetes bacterium]|nr:NUDIX domain-containing protein [Planctomycetota bacterium]